MNRGCAEGNIIPGWTKIPPPRGPIPTYPTLQVETSSQATPQDHNIPSCDRGCGETYVLACNCGLRFCLECQARGWRYKVHCMCVEHTLGMTYPPNGYIPDNPFPEDAPIPVFIAKTAQDDNDGEFRLDASIRCIV